MSELSSLLAKVVEAPVWMLLLLKVTALLAAGWVLHFALRRANPRWRVLLWRGVAIGLIGMPVVMVVMPAIELSIATPPTQSLIPAAPDHTDLLRLPLLPEIPRTGPITTPGIESVPVTPDEHPSALRAQMRRWSLTTVWLLGAAVLAFRFGLGHRRVRKFVASSEPAPQTVISECRKVADALRCKAQVDVRSVTGLSVPFLTGLRRPVLLLPEHMCDPAYSADLPAILAHELSHLCARDLRWGYVLHWISIALWFHPLVWPVRPAHASACEQVSDAVSAHFVGDTQAYSRTLARVVVDIASRPPATAGIPIVRTSDIARRLKALKRRVFSAPLPRRRVLALIAISLLCIAILGAIHITYTRATGEEEKTGAVPPEVQIQIDRLQSGDMVQRSIAIRKLGEFGEAAAPAVPLLIEILDEEWDEQDGEIGRVKSWIYWLRIRLGDFDVLHAFMTPAAEQATYALSKIGEPAVEPLIAALDHESSAVRSRAAEALGLTRDMRAIEPLIARLDDRDGLVRWRAAWALGDIDDARAVEPLIDIVENADEDADVRVSAAMSLGRIGDRRSVEPLIVALTDNDADLRKWAARSLGQIADARARDPLLAAMKDGDAAVREAAAASLGQIGDNAPADVLLAALEDGEPAAQKGAAVALGSLEDARALEPLLLALQDEDASVREAAARGLGGMTERRAAEALIGALGDPERDVRAQARSSLDLVLLRLDVQRQSVAGSGEEPSNGDATEPAPPLLSSGAVEQLIAKLDDKEDMARSRAADALGWAEDPRVLDPLINALRDKEPWVRRCAAGALGRIGDRRAVDPLLLALDDSDDDVREAAASALGQIGDERAAESLISTLADRSDGVRAYAANGLGKIRDRRAVAPLISALHDEAPLVRTNAAMALGQMKDDRALEPLIDALGDEDVTVRRSVAEALGKTADNRVIQPLFTALKDESWLVWTTAANSLRTLEESTDLRPSIAAQAQKDAVARKRLALQGIDRAIAGLKSTDALSRTIAALSLARREASEEDTRAIESLVDGLDDPDMTVREFSAEALQRITQQHFGQDQAKWREWWEENKADQINNPVLERLNNPKLEQEIRSEYLRWVGDSWLPGEFERTLEEIDRK